MTDQPDDLTHYMQKCGDLTAALAAAERKIKTQSRMIASVEKQQTAALTVAEARIKELEAELAKR